MATIGQGILGGFSGKVGPVVGYQWRGRWCLRGRPMRVRNPRTEAQQRHRMMFREEVRLASRFNWIIRQSLEELSQDEGLTPCNYFVKENQKCFGWAEEYPLPPAGDSPYLRGRAEEGEAGRLTVDWGSLVLSHGPVAPVGFGAPEVTEGGSLRIRFEKNPLHMRADTFDRVYLYLYCAELDEGCPVAPVYRYSQEINVVLPDTWAGREVQMWGMVNDDRGRWSETIYIGCGSLTSAPSPMGEERLAEPLEQDDCQEYSECFDGSDFSDNPRPSDTQPAVGGRAAPSGLG